MWLIIEIVVSIDIWLLLLLFVLLILWLLITMCVMFFNTYYSILIMLIFMLIFIFIFMLILILEVNMVCNSDFGLLCFIVHWIFVLHQLKCWMVLHELTIFLWQLRYCWWSYCCSVILYLCYLLTLWLLIIRNSIDIVLDKVEL